MQGSLYKKVGVASLIMMASVFLSRVIGVLRESVIAYVGGVTSQVDAYQVAFVIPELLNHVVATGFLSITIIPIFNAYLVEDREEEAWRVFSRILTVLGSGLLLLILVSCVWADFLVGLFAPGLHDPVTKALAVKMTRIILPAQFFFFSGGLFMAVQFCRERFFVPALAPLIYNLGIILGGLVLGPWLGVEGFAWGVLAGSFAGNFVVQWHGARQVGMKISLIFDPLHPDLKRYFLLTLPLMVGMTMTFSTEFLFRFFGSYMPEGAIAALNYGLRVMLVLVGLFGQAMGTASYPYMSRLAAEGRMDEMNQLLNRTMRYLSLVIPFSVLLMVLRHEVVFILFCRGSFDMAATQLTSGLLPFLLVGAFAFSAQTIVVRGYYAMQNTLFPAIFGTVAVVISLPFFWLGMKWLGPAGIALGVSLSALFQVTLLFVLWNRRSDNAGAEVYGFVGKMILMSIFLGVVLELFRRTILFRVDPWGLQGALITSILCGTLFLCLLYLSGRVMGIRELSDLFGKICGKIKERVR
jgi:putative peptidoglycan lipid II flippase